MASTVFKFQAKNLAHRFRSLETQLKKLIEIKESKAILSEKTDKKTASVVIIDEVVINNPALAVARVRTMVAELEKRRKNGSEASHPAVDPESFCNALVGKAKMIIGKERVRAVKFQIVEEKDGPKVKGEVICAPE